MRVVLFIKELRKIGDAMVKFRRDPSEASVVVLSGILNFAQN